MATKRPEVIEATFVAEPTTITGLVKYEGSAKAEMTAEKTSAEELLTLITEMTIENQDDLDLAADALAKVKGEWKRLEERKKKVTGPLSAALDEVRSWFLPAQKFYKQAEDKLKVNIAQYHTRRAEQNVLSLQAAAQAHAQGDREAVGDAIAEIDVPEKIPGLGLRPVWDFEIVDFEKVPRKYLFVNETAVREAMKASLAVSKSAEPAPIPGIKFVQRTIVSSRSK